MNSPPARIRFGDSELLVVPAKHFCHLFAQEVYRICSSPVSRPEAIAVELGPGICAAAASWIRELGAGGSPGQTLPVMLALIRRNRMIRPSLKEKALRLQMETGKDLSELPPEVLHRELRYSSHSVLFLSPGDSIIEAVRCALELDIPAYGVDLEETAGGIYEPIVIQDPGSASGGIAAFVANNLAYADASRDEEIDSRREYAMAARLKALLGRHRRVVFTCGMAHWLKIRELLADQSVRPSPLEDSRMGIAGEFKRVVVHPAIAAQHMDPFPALVHAYEKRRSPAGASRAGGKRSRPLAAGTIFRSRLRSACREYFSGETAVPDGPEHVRDLECFRAFENYLDNLCRLNHRVVPDLSLIAQSAQQMMSKAFAQTVVNAFMAFPWASPDDHPGCQLLQPPSDPADSHAGAVALDDGSVFERRLFIRSIPACEGPTGAPKLSYRWNKARNRGYLPSSYTWRPWEYLISSMSYRAIRSGIARLRRTKPVVFEGSLLDGIDVKSTIRASSRGNESIYVRDSLFEAVAGIVSPIDGFPVVWILNPGNHPNSDWKVLHEPASFMERHIRDKASFLEVKSSRGGEMVALLAYGGVRSRTRHSFAGEVFKVEQYHGIAVFQPISWTNRQFARWAEITQYKRNPFCHDTLLSRSGRSELRDSYERNHDIRIGEHDWETTLILLALPYAPDLLTVVVPEGFRVKDLVFARARKQGVRVATTSLKSFSPEEISRLAACPLVPVTDIEPETRYSKSLEKAIGERQTKNRHMVPAPWLNFGGGR